MANKRPLVLDDLGGGAGAIREAGDGECEALIGSPYCTYLGTANTIALTVNDALGTPSSYVAGAQYRFRASLANTGAATINVAGLGAKTAVTVTGVALPAGYIRTDVDTVITYDAPGNRFVVGRELERGSNANGSFLRWDTGALETQQTVDFDLNALSFQSYPAPAGFTSTVWSLTVSYRTGTADGYTRAKAITAHNRDASQFYLLFNTAGTTLTTVSGTINLTVVGKGFWY